MGNKDLNYIAALEKAVSEQYGDIAAANPKAFWTQEKEQEYQKSLESSLKEEYSRDQTKQYHIDGEIQISKNILKHEWNKNCSCCKKRSFSKFDDIYLVKFQTCQNCYIKHIEGREERWLSGWRPS